MPLGLTIPSPVMAIFFMLNPVAKINIVRTTLCGYPICIGQAQRPAPTFYPSNLFNTIAVWMPEKSLGDIIIILTFFARALFGT